MKLKTNHILPKNCRAFLVLLFCAGIFAFWWLAYPHALSYQEQYQLFLWNGDYFCQRLSHPGGLADYLGEFVVQFYYVEWLGAMLLALLFLALQSLQWLWTRGEDASMVTCLSTFVSPLLLLWCLGDESVLLSGVVALLLSWLTALVMRRMTRSWRHDFADVVVVPVLFWLLGPLAFVYALLRMCSRPKKYWWSVPLMLLMPFAALYLEPQRSLAQLFTGLNYYRIPLQQPWMLYFTAFVSVMLAALTPYLNRLRTRFFALSSLVLLLLLAVVSWKVGYDSDKYELIRQDYLLRNERWDEIIKRAEHHQVQTAFSSNCVNLSLAMKRQLAERMFDFYQSGEDALIMPRVRDLTSNIPTAEAFWRLGMVNSAQRYVFDMQESILNARKSGRFTKRIAECMLVNGHYQVAEKHLALLEQSLFYRKWASRARTLLYSDPQVDADPVLGKVRRLRYREDFLYSYEEIDKMLGLLFVNNPENKLALDYFMGEQLLKGNVQTFQQYMGWVQQYGGYSMMPRGYQDAMQCIQSHGRAAGSSYGNYVRRMMK